MATIKDLIQNIQIFIPYKDINPLLLDFVADIKGKLWTIEILTKNLNDIIAEFVVSQTPTINIFFKAHVYKMFSDNTSKIQKFCFTLLMSLLIYKERLDYLSLYYNLFTKESDIEVYCFFHECKSLCLNIKQIAEQKFTNLDGIFMSNKQWQIVINQSLNYNIEQIKNFEHDLQKELIRLKHEKVEKIVKYCRSGEYSLNFFLKECLLRFSAMHQAAFQERTVELEEYKKQVHQKLRGDYGLVLSKISKGRISKFVGLTDDLEDEITNENFKEQEKQRLIEEIKNLTRRTNQFKISGVKLMSYVQEVDPFFDEIKHLINIIREYLNQLKKDKPNGKIFETISGQASQQMISLLDRGSRINAKTSSNLKKLLIKTNPVFYNKIQQRESEFRPGVRKLIRELKTIVFSDRFSITMNRDAKNLEKLKDELHKLFNKFEKLENSDYLILDTVFKNYNSANRRESAFDNAMNNVANKLEKLFESAISEKDEEGHEENGNGNEENSEKIIKEFETNMDKYTSLSKDLAQSELSKHLQSQLKSKIKETNDNFEINNDKFNNNNNFEEIGSDKIDQVKKFHNSDYQKCKADNSSDKNVLTLLQKSEDEEKYVDRIQKEAVELQRNENLKRKNNAIKSFTNDSNFENITQPLYQKNEYEFMMNKNKDDDMKNKLLDSQPNANLKDDNESMKKRKNNPFAKKQSPTENETPNHFNNINDNPFKRRSSRNNAAYEKEETSKFHEPDFEFDNLKESKPLGNSLTKKDANQYNPTANMAYDYNKKPQVAETPTFKNFDNVNSNNISLQKPIQKDNTTKKNSSDKIQFNQQDDNFKMQNFDTFENSKVIKSKDNFLAHNDSQINKQISSDETVAHSNLKDSKGLISGMNKQKLENSLNNEALANINLQNSNSFNFNPRLSGTNNYNPRFSNESNYNPRFSDGNKNNQRISEDSNYDKRHSGDLNDNNQRLSSGQNRNPRFSEEQNLLGKLSESKANAQEIRTSNSNHFLNEGKNSDFKNDSSNYNNKTIENRKSEARDSAFHDPKIHNDVTRTSKPVVTPAIHENAPRSFQHRVSDEKISNLDDILNRVHRQSSDQNSPRTSKHQASQDLFDSEAQKMEPGVSENFRKKSIENKNSNIPELRELSHNGQNLKRPSSKISENSINPAKGLEDEPQTKVLKNSKASLSNKSKNPFENNSDGNFVDSNPYEGSGESGNLKSDQNSQKFPNDPNLIQSLKDSFGKYNDSDKTPTNPPKFQNSNAQVENNYKDVNNENEKKNLPLFSSFGEQNRKSKNSSTIDHFNAEEPQRLSKVSPAERTSIGKQKSDYRNSQVKKEIQRQSIIDSNGKVINLLLSSDPKDKENNSSIKNSKIMNGSQIEEPNNPLDLKNLDSIGDLNRLIDDAQMPSHLNSLQKSFANNIDNSSQHQKIEPRTSQPTNLDARASLAKVPSSKTSIPAPSELKSSLPRLSDPKEPRISNSIKISNPSLVQSDVNIIREQKVKQMLRNLDSFGNGEDFIPETKTSQVNSLSLRSIIQNNTLNASINTTTTTNLDNYDLFKQNLDHEIDKHDKKETLGPVSIIKNSDYKFSRPTESLNELIEKNDKIGEISNDDFLSEFREDKPESFHENTLIESKNEQLSKFGKKDEHGLPIRSIKRPKGQAIAQETGMKEPGEKSVKNFFKGFFGQRNE